MNRSATQQLLIPYIGEPLLSDTQEIVSKIKLEGITTWIDKINWSDYPYKPLVQVCTGYSKSHLWLLYEVKNDYFRAKASVDQEAVWQDSCVEFFITTGDEINWVNQLNEEIIYRNFEFNVIGCCLSAYGSKFHREKLPMDLMRQILRFPGLSKQNLPEEGTEFDWELCVAIPLDLLGLQPGSSFRANFYKCGDLTSKPHFLSWGSIETDSPDFHQPHFFGEIKLVI